jgi:hypothetical protein
MTIDETGQIASAISTNAGIGTNNIANSAITTLKIGNNQVTTAKIADAQVTNAKMAPYNLPQSVRINNVNLRAMNNWTDIAAASIFSYGRPITFKLQPYAGTGSFGQDAACIVYGSNTTSGWSFRIKYTLNAGSTTYVAQQTYIYGSFGYTCYAPLAYEFTFIPTNGTAVVGTLQGKYAGSDASATAVLYNSEWIAIPQ